MSKIVIYCDDLGGAKSPDDPTMDAGLGMFFVDNGIFRLNKVLENHPQVVVTMFIVPSWSNENHVDEEIVEWGATQPIDDNRHGFRDWIQKLDKSEQYELQLHGYTHKYNVKHFIPFFCEGFFEKLRKTTQEFENITRKTAFEKVEKSVELFETVFGRKPQGFRFPGWKSGVHGVEAVNSSNVRWIADNPDKRKIDERNGLIDLPIGYRLSRITIDDVDKELSSKNSLFITTHVEGAVPGNSRLNNSVYWQHRKLDDVLTHIEKNYNADFVGADEHVKNIEK